jgi:uncharacterized protein YaeQ
MAQPSTLYRIKLELSDIDRNVYESLDFRVALHPSELVERLVARILGYALLYEEQLEFGKGISTEEEPDLWARDLTGRILHWVEVGTPSAERIHMANKKADRMSIVCHKGQEALDREVKKRPIHRAASVDVLHLEPLFVAALAKKLTRSSQWTVVHTDGELSITIDDESFAGQVKCGVLSDG